MANPSPDLGELLTKRAELCAYHTPEAVEFGREALALFQKAVGDQHVMVADARRRLARAHYEAGELEAALAEIEAALAIFAAIHPVGSEFVQDARALRMLVRHDLGEPRALDGIEEVIASLGTKHVLGHRLEQLR
jgi:tetratricopeptide (TPR) repeat protein